MNTNTGEVKVQLTQEEKKNGQWKEIDEANLPERKRKQLAATGRTTVSRNSPCPCGSRKRFKRCCMSAAARG